MNRIPQVVTPASALTSFSVFISIRKSFHLQYFMIFLYTGFLLTISAQYLILSVRFSWQRVCISRSRKERNSSKKGRVQFSTLYFHARNIFHHVEFPGRSERYFFTLVISEIHLHSTHLSMSICVFNLAFSSYDFIISVRGRREIQRHQHFDSLTHAKLIPIVI